MCYINFPVQSLPFSKLVGAKFQAKFTFACTIFTFLQIDWSALTTSCTKCRPFPFWAANLWSYTSVFCFFFKFKMLHKFCNYARMCYMPQLINMQFMPNLGLILYSPWLLLSVCNTYYLVVWVSNWLGPLPLVLVQWCWGMLHPFQTGAPESRQAKFWIPLQSFGTTLESLGARRQSCYDPSQC